MSSTALQLQTEVHENQEPSMADLTIWYQWWEKSRHNTYTKICNLYDALEPGDDPISFLYRKYYDEQKSLSEILKTSEVKSVDFVSRATLHRLLFEHLWWEPRKNTERTPVHEGKLAEKTKSEIELFEKRVVWILWKREIPRAFKIEEFIRKRYNMGRALYVLKTYGGIDKAKLLKIVQQEWVKEEDRLSKAAIAYALNKQLQDILVLYPELTTEYGITNQEIELSSRSIERWFNWNTGKRQ